MRILILTFYFRPDLSAGAFRTTALVQSLSEAAPGAQIDVLTTLPNRYHSFAAEAPQEEQAGAVRVRRIALPSHKSGVVDQSRAFGAFARQVLREVRGRRYDLVVATSSRLFTAYLGALCARRLKAPLYLDIRDIFTDTVSDVFGGAKAKLLLPVLARIERKTLLSARRVNVVSAGFLPYFKARYPTIDYRVFTNGIDAEFLEHDFGKGAAPGPKTLLYAGNVGEGQGLDRIVPGLARQLGEGYELIVIGDGGTRHKLEQAVAAAGVRNVRIEPPVPRAELFEYYRRADCLFLHLNAYQAFEKVLPSKIFEYAATGKPILAGVAGYAAEFLRQEVPNSATFAPGDVAGAAAALERLDLQLTPRDEFIEHFRRVRIMADMARDVLEVVGQ